MFRHYVFSFALIFFAALGGAGNADEIRAIWVTRWDYKSAADVRSIIDNSIALGFNMILFQCRGNATAFYHSDIEPWAWELTGTAPASLGADPGWDPLAVAASYARERGIELHAFINVYPGWHGMAPPPLDAPQLYNTHRDWFVADNTGTTVPLNTNYLYLSPGIPAVQDYLFNIAMEIIENYDVAGLHLDHMRYPGAGYSYDAVSLQRFAEATGGGTPQTMPAEWSQWRREQVSALMRRIYQGAHSRKPSIMVSVSTEGSYAGGRDTFFQDAYAWMKEGILDVSFKKTYNLNAAILVQWISDGLSNRGNRQFVAAVDASDASVVQQLTGAIRSMGTDGIAFFSYAYLCPSHKPTSTALAIQQNFFVFPDIRPPMLWLNAPDDDDALGPIISGPRAEPASLPQGLPFRLICGARDESGIPDKGVRVLWAADADPRLSGVLMNMPYQTGNYYCSEFAISIPVTTNRLYYQIHASDNDAENGVADRAMRISPIFSIKTSPNLIYNFHATGGTAGANSQYGAVDGAGRIWVCDSANSRIVIYDPNGTQAFFSPITTGRDAAGQPISLQNLAGICHAPDGTIWASLEKMKMLARFESATGKPLNGVALTFNPGDVDADYAGEIFEAHRTQNAWTFWTGSPADGATSATITGPDYPVFHLSRAVGCTKDGGRVYQTSDADRSVWIWERAGAGSKVFTRKQSRLCAVSSFAGGVDVANNGWVFVSDSGNKVIRLYSPEGALLQEIKSGNPAIEPCGVAIKPDASMIYIIPSSGEPNIQVWSHAETSANSWLFK